MIKFHLINFAKTTRIRELKPIPERKATSTRNRNRAINGINLFHRKYWHLSNFSKTPPSQSFFSFPAIEASLKLPKTENFVFS
jgi:hypothetical protein